MMDVWLLVKIGFLLIFFIYVVFAFVVREQVKLMTKTLDVDFDKVIKILADVHLVVAVFIFLFAILLL
jgi:hypothetical protein